MDPTTPATNGPRIHFAVEGSGPDVIFVHGWAASRRMWAALASQLARTYRCWSLDWPGCGDSEHPGYAWFSIPNLADLLKDFMQAQGLQRVRLVGHSMGGMVALDFAARHPDLVERLVVINPVVTGQSRLRYFDRPPLSERALGRLQWLSPAFFRRLCALPLGARLAGLQCLRRRAEDFGRAIPDALLASGRATVAYDVSPALDRIRAPSLVIVGTYDLNVPGCEGRLAARCIPEARLYVMRAGHLVTDDRPQDVLQQLESFFA